VRTSRPLHGAIFLSVTFLLLAGCGSGSYGGGGMSTTPTVATELTWDAAAPTAASVTRYQTVLYKFTYPNNNTGNPGANIVVAAGGDVAAFLCATAMCGPGQSALDSKPAITASDRLTTAPPGPMGTQAVYYVAVNGAMASNFTIEAQ
jgi:hypothetical protein